MFDKGSSVVAGVVPGQRPIVVRKAAGLAKLLEGELFVVHVDPGAYAPPDGHWAEVDPDASEAGRQGDGFPASLRNEVESLLESAEIEWELVAERGSAVKALSAIAEREAAAAIVIGSREPGLRSRVREAVSGKVCEGLARCQSRPVIVIPQGSRVE